MKIKEEKLSKHFNCQQCKFGSDSFKEMIQHFNQQHKESLHCIFCRKLFRTPIWLLLHFKSHGRQLYCSQHFVAFSSLDEMLAHRSRPGHDLECGVCVEKFRSKEARDSHRKIHLKIPKRQSIKKNEEISTNFTCNQCEYQNENFKQCFEHLQSDHKDTLNCILCEKSFENHLQLLAHMKVHGKSLYCGHHFIAFESKIKYLNHCRERGHNSQCGICFQVLRSRSHRNSHKRIHLNIKSDKKGEYKCPQCPLVYEYVGSLRRHIKTAHEKRMRFLCEDCGVSFSTNSHLKKHISIKHKQETVKNSFQCEFCGKKFNENGHMKIHKANHLGHSDICNYCKDSFDSPEKLKEHVESLNHHTFQCSKCSATFRAKAHLLNHLLRHDESPLFKKKEDPAFPKKKRDGLKLKRSANGKYACTVCGREFASAPNMRRHMDLHSGVRKYKCEKCGKDFKQYAGLKNHLTVHSEERPYECSICGSRFKDSSTFSKHKKVHGESSVMGHTPRFSKTEKTQYSSEDDAN